MWIISKNLKVIIRSINSSKTTESNEGDENVNSFLSKKESEEDKLPRDVLFDDEKSDNARLIYEAASHNLALFVPDSMFLNLVENFRNARKLYGETFIRLLTGFDPDYIERNLKIPEFKKLLKKKITDKIQELKKNDLLDENYQLTDLAYEFSIVETSLKELENVKSNSFSFRKGSVKSKEGITDEIVKFTPNFSIKDVAIRNTVRKAVSRNHRQIQIEDLSVYEHINENKVETIICIDASSSMKGEKIANSKKAALVLAYKSIKNHDSVGLLVFQDRIVDRVKPTKSLKEIVSHVSKIRTGRMTNLALAIKEAIPLFSKNVTKNLIIITDAMPTSGEEPLNQTLNAALLAREKKVHLTIVGVGLTKETTEIAKKIVDFSKGVLYIVKNPKDLDVILIEEYYSLKSKISFS